MTKKGVTTATKQKPALLEFDKQQFFAVPNQSNHNWHDYFRGVVAEFAALGHTILPFDSVIVGSVPLGGGLSSSASLEVAVATFLEALLQVQIPKTKKAILCQQAEHRFAGVPCGVMDQFIAVFGKQDHALLIDCRSFETKDVALTNPKITVLITNSNVKHALTGGEYAKRRQQCEKAVEVLRTRYSHIKALRDATLKELDSVRGSLDDVHYRRARHVITENNRTTQACSDLTAGDYAKVGVAMIASHRSLRDDYEVSCPELDILVEIATECKGVYGSRMTGGGFGGCTVTLVETDQANLVAATLKKKYLERTKREPTIMTSRPSQGTRQILLQKSKL